LARERVRAVVNIGLAGALTPSLECGDLIIAQEVRGRDSICPTASLLKAATRIQLQGSKIYAGTIITLDKILCRASEKQQLAQQLSPGTIACVDMESAAVAEVCQQLQTPCLIVRSISDRSAEDLPLDFNRCRKKAGNLDLFRLLFLALQQPTSFYGLLELRRRSRRSAEHLARFVEQLTRMGVEGI
jgi:nucleoside phosphorylase